MYNECIHYMYYFHSFDSLVSYFEGEPSYYLNDKSLPMLEYIPSYKKRIYSVKDIVHLLLFPDLQKSGFVCSKVPTSIHQSVSFIVNLGQLDSPKNVLADDMGVWRHNGVDTVHVSVTFNEGQVQMVRISNSSIAPGRQIYSVRRVYHTHATDSTLKKITACIYGMY